MKKYMTICLLMAMTFAAASCDSDTRSLRNETTEDVIWRSLEIKADNWVRCSDRDGLNSYYTTSISVPQITNQVLRGGVVNCYLYDGDAQAQLPSVRHYENAAHQFWTRTIDYEYYSGGVTFYVTDSDFAGTSPGVLFFRLMMAW